MERVIRQTILRRNQIAIKSRRTDLKELRKQWREYNQHQLMHKNIMQTLVRDEQKARREDWICGPLAPNRDAGDKKGKYGSVPNMMQIGGKIPARYLQGPRGRGSDLRGSEDKTIFPNGEWSGRGISGNIAIGDRVAVINGRPGVKGLIGEVSKVNKAERQIVIKDVNKADVMAAPGTPIMNDRTVATELNINMSDVRLVMQMQDPEKGLNRDYIVGEVRGGPPYLQREVGSNLPRHTRYIEGTEFQIPWPADEFHRAYTRDDDTTRLSVDEQTYIPSLVYEPLEEGVIDELRGKYSRTRKTHDDVDWLRKKVLEDARKTWLEQRVNLMMRKQADGLDQQGLKRISTVVTRGNNEFDQRPLTSRPGWQRTASWMESYLENKHKKDEKVAV